MHLTVTIGNSESTVSGLTPELFSRLRRCLSYRVDNFTGFNFPKYLITRRGVFPTGLLYVFAQWARKTGVQVKYNDTRKVPSRYKIISMNLEVTPYPEQIAAAEACLKRHRGIIVAPTGLGKSIIAALIIEKLKVRTLIVVPSLELKRQLTKSLKRIFGSSNVGDRHSGRFICVENVDALPCKPLSTQYDCLIVDEFHHAAAKTYRKLNTMCWKDIYYRFGLSATPFRSDFNERLLLESFLASVIYRIPYSKAVDNEYICPLEAYYLEVGTTPHKGANWASVYKELVVKNTTRNTAITDMLRKLKSTDKSTLCLVKEIEHGTILSNLTGIPFANGQDGQSQALITEFNDRELPCLIATTGVCGEGVDTKAAEYIIIAGLGKSKNAIMQWVGRGFRMYPGKESCKVILFKDNSHRWTKAHFKAQCKVLLDEYGVTPLQI